MATVFIKPLPTALALEPHFYKMLAKLNFEHRLGSAIKEERWYALVTNCDQFLQISIFQWDVNYNWKCNYSLNQ